MNRSKFTIATKCEHVYSSAPAAIFMTPLFTSTATADSYP